MLRRSEVGSEIKKRVCQCNWVDMDHRREIWKLRFRAFALGRSDEADCHEDTLASPVLMCSCSTPGLGSLEGI